MAESSTGRDVTAREECCAPCLLSCRFCSARICSRISMSGAALGGDDRGAVYISSVGAAWTRRLWLCAKKVESSGGPLQGEYIRVQDSASFEFRSDVVCSQLIGLSPRD